MQQKEKIIKKKGINTIYNISTERVGKMETIKNIQNAIDYIENNLCEQISINDIARKAYMSASKFRRLFLSLCGITVGEYIRLRKLTLAGKDIISGNEKIIDIAFKYGYESHESFSRAFLRFHNVSPMEARNTGEINVFSRISVKSILGDDENMRTNWFFQSENSICNLRSAGVLIKNGKILLQREKGGNEYAIPGGLVLQGETAEEAVIRRYQEESNVKIETERLIWVEECFWEWNNKNTHTICFYYLINLKEGDIQGDEFISQTGNPNVEYGWVDLKEVNSLILYPSFAKNEVFDSFNEVKHFVSRE